jgi:hypothetical protein
MAVIEGPFDGIASVRFIWRTLLRLSRNGSVSLALGVLLIALSVSLNSSCWAQAPSGAGNPAVDDEPLSEKVTDPLAYLTQIQIKDIYAPAEYGTNAQPNTVQIRSIFSIRPFWLIPFEQLIRPTMKVESTPDGKGASTTTAYDDMQLLDLFVMPWPDSQKTHFRWGLGPYFIFPTSTSNLLGQGAWQMGPATGFSYRGIQGLNIAGLMQQATSFVYTSSHSKPITSITFQPIVTYQLGNGWSAKSSDATWTFNLRHKTSTTIPLSAGLGKVWKLSDNYAVDTSISGEWMIYRQFSSQTEQFTLNFTVSLLLPKLDL